MKVKIAKTATPEPPAPTPTPTPDAPEVTSRVRPLVGPKAPRNSKNTARVLLPVLDGKIEWEKMTPEARRSFEDLFKDREFLSQFGLGAIDKAFKPEQMKMMYDGISAMYQTVVRFFLHWPTPALQMLAYSDGDKDALAEPTANLANQFAPDLLKRHQEVIIWGAVFMGVTQKNFMAASQRAKEIEAEQRRARPQAVQPVPTPIRPVVVTAAPITPAPIPVPPAQDDHESLG